jgi:hypothetical protein
MLQLAIPFFARRRSLLLAALLRHCSWRTRSAACRRNAGVPPGPESLRLEIREAG